VKVPIMPKELEILFYLSGRRALSDNEQLQYKRSRRGFEGEWIFRSYMKEVFGYSQLGLFSLLLPRDGAVFQLDHVMVLPGLVLFHEVKHFSGDVVVDGKRWYVMPGGERKEMNNPFVQARRAESLLRQLLNGLAYDWEVDHRIVFPHEEFALFGARYDWPIVLRSQLGRYLRDLRRRFIGSDFWACAQLENELRCLQLAESPYERLPKYDFARLRRGVNCPSCMGMMEAETVRTVKCVSCGRRLVNQQALKFNARQLKVLFPERELTASLLYDWCGGRFSRYTIRLYLNKC